MTEHAHYREAHPFVFVLMHWINLLGIGFLILSGLYIHYPAFGGVMGLAKGAHIFWAFVVVINLLVRIILAFFVKDATMQGSREVEADIRNWLPQKANRHQLWPTIKFYLLAKKEHPIQAKYGVLQKAAYLTTIPLILVAAYTGLCLWGPTAQWSFFAAGTEAIGGLMYMRIVHFFIMWAVVCFAMVHVYMVAITAIPLLKLMLLGRETVPDNS
jgi:Ni/Fe-hydrogenase 1 B-type cytochrome subunit